MAQERNQRGTKMADEDLSLEGATPEVVAYHLMLKIMAVEGRPLTGSASVASKVTRNVVLDAYADCLEAVRGNRSRRTIAPRA